VVNARKLLKYLWLDGHEQGPLLLAHAASVSLEPILMDQVSTGKEMRKQCRESLLLQVSYQTHQSRADSEFIMSQVWCQPIF
jgi:hypothetical protein